MGRPAAPEGWFEQALADGHEVAAVARRPAAFGLTHQQLSVPYGDVTDPASLGPALEGKEAVVSTVGSSRHKPTTPYSSSTRNTLEAMRAAEVCRFVGVSSIGFADDPNDPS